MKEICQACGSEDVKNCGYPILQNEDSKYSVIECNKCKLMWASPMPTDNDLTLHYNAYYQRRFKRILKASLKFLRDIITLKTLREYFFLKHATKYTNVRRFLDYGCGEGEMLELGNKLGWDCTGTEYSKELADKFESLGLNVVIATDFESSSLEQNSFDLILFKHLIEHIKDIPTFLNQTKKYLSKGGIVAVKTPSNTTLRAKTKTAKWHFVNPPEHQWSFNTVNFKLLMEKNGFEVLSIKNSLLVDELICFAKVKI